MRREVRPWRRRAQRYLVPLLALAMLVTTVLTATGLFPRNTTQAATAGWATYLGSNARTGFNAAETTINATTAANLKLLWKVKTVGHVSSEPLLVNGVLYWGGWDGIMHATDPATGQDHWTTPLGIKVGSCGTQSFGVVGTAAVATEAINGTPTQVVYVGAGQDNLYALNAQTGAILWQTNLGNVPAEIIYGSPAVYNGSVYIGVSSSGDCPLMQGALYQLNASTGAIQHALDAVPSGCIGAGIWDSPTIDESTGMLYFGTGNADPINCKTTEPLASSLVEVRASDLTIASTWQFTPTGLTDADVGSTPTLFSATIGGVSHAMIGLESKDGNYYAFDRSKVSGGPLWKAAISVAGRNPELGLGSISSSAYDGTRLYVAGGNTTIGGVACLGSLRALDPNTGTFLWQLCRNNPALDGVIAVPGLVVVGAGNTLALVNSATGSIAYSFTDTDSNAKFWGSATIANGVLYAGSRSGDLFALGTDTAPPTPTPGSSPSPTGTPPPTLPPGPVSQTWYFAEGKVGQGFTQYLTIQNPDPLNACTVSIQYLLSSSTPAPKSITVAPNTRWTEGVNGDLGVAASSSGYQAVSTILSVSNPASCTGVVAERPIYFTNFKGVSSGTDALGATKLGSDFYFADVSTLSGYNSYITILNPPGAVAATITATYYLGGVMQGSDTLVVAPGTRGTILPKSLGARAAAWVHATAPVVVERPTYFADYSAGTAQRVWGAATVVGAPVPASDWRFAEGYVGSGFQENLVLANFGSSVANATVVLEYDNGSRLTNTYAITAQASLSLDVNAATATHAGVCAPTACALSQSVSAEITTSAGASIVAEREMFFHFNHFDRALNQTTTAMGGTDVIGQSGTARATSYSFSEGYTFPGYDEWLTVQNPTNNVETVWVTLSNGKGTVYAMALVVGAHSRYTVNVDEPVVLRMYHSGDGTAGYQVSLTVQTTDKSVFVAERPLYWNASGTQGGDDVLGYLGG